MPAYAQLLALAMVDLASATSCNSTDAASFMQAALQLARGVSRGAVGQEQMLSSDGGRATQRRHQTPDPDWVAGVGQDVKLLDGTWDNFRNDSGFVLFTVPFAEDDKMNMTIATMYEQLLVKNLDGPVRDRDYQAKGLALKNDYLAGVVYSKTAWNIDALQVHNEDPADAAFHSENGYILDSRTSPDDEAPFASVLKTASNPHGVATNAAGDFVVVSCKDQADTCMDKEYTELEASITSAPLNMDCNPVFALEDYYLELANGTGHFDITRAKYPAVHLREAAAGLKLAQYMKWNASSTAYQPVGHEGISSSPFLLRKIVPTDYRFIMYLLTVDAGNGETYQLIQYIELVYLGSLPSCNGERGLFPHIGMNTLKRMP